jgi:peptidoglycan/xylan/chitin deacetylase (PgdA/CDA1 family)
VSLTFDCDAEAGVLGQAPGAERRLSTLSDARFGVVRGLPRILGLLDEQAITATFYVPGDTAERHRDAIKAVAEAGHEVAHHGHLHLRPDGIDPARQREELEQGTAALVDCVGARPTGYRSPDWELTPDTLALLVEAGFAYDSSCMGDDRPYFEQADGASLLELPVHWSLDDWPYWGFSNDTGDQLSPPSALLEVWTTEFESALQEQRHITYTMHPEITGRGYRIAALERFIHTIRERATIWFATHHQTAELIQSELPGSPPDRG